MCLPPTLHMDTLLGANFLSPSKPLSLLLLAELTSQLRVSRFANVPETLGWPVFRVPTSTPSTSYQVPGAFSSVACLMVETRPILLEKHRCALSCRVVPKSSGSLENLIFSRQLECCQFWHDDFLCTAPPSMDFRCVQNFQLFNVRDHDVSFPDAPHMQHISSEDSWQNFRAKLAES